MAAQVHDVDGRAGHLGDGERAVRAFGFQARGPGQGVVLRLDVSLGERNLDELVDHDAVLGVHADESPLLSRLAHGPEDGGVVREQHAGIRHEQLVAGHPFVGEAAHLRHPLAGQVRDDHVERVVDGGVAVRLGVPRVEALEGGLAAGLDREVDDARRAAESGGAGAGLEGVGRLRAPERHLHVGVGIDPAGDYEPLRRVDDAVGVHRQVAADQRHGLAFDEDVRAVVIDGGHDPAVLDQNAHADSRVRFTACSPGGSRRLRRSYPTAIGNRRLPPVRDSDNRPSRFEFRARTKSEFSVRTKWREKRECDGQREPIVSHQSRTACRSSAKVSVEWYVSKGAGIARSASDMRKRLSHDGR